MNEEERRQEILRAEEAIRQLAGEMARASGEASQAEAAREKLDEARTAVIKAVDDLNQVISNQKTVNSETTEALGQAKKSLEDAINTLMDVGVHIDRIETHITEAVDKIKAITKIVESSPVKLSAALSRELSQVDKTAKERHNASIQILEGNSNKLQEISQSIEENHKNIFESLDSKLSQVDNAAIERHAASMRTLESKSKMITETLNNQGLQLSSLIRGGIILAALGLLGIWVSAVILLIR